MKKMLVICLSALVLAVSVAQANDQSSGCGLGWEVFKKNSLVSSFGRAITNAVTSNTIAMTLGTSGCAKHDIVQKEKEAEFYAEANYQKLQSEMAEGQGEHLVAFAKIMGCSESSAARAGAVMQQNYEKIFNGKTMPVEMLSRSADAVYASDLNCTL